MKNKLTFFAIPALLITSSLCGCSSNNGNYATKSPKPSSSVVVTLDPETKASNQPEEISLLQVEKIEKINDFNGSYWISDNEILGVANPLSPKPARGPNIVYPDRPVHVYNTLDKSKKSIDDIVMTRFESMDVISPDRKNVIWLSKSWAKSMLNIETKKVSPLGNTEQFFSSDCFWLNNNELIYLSKETEQETSTVHKYNIDGTDTKIRTLDKQFESLFMLEDRIYLIEGLNSISNSASTAYYTDTSFSELHKLGEFYGNISLIGNEIILNKPNSHSKSASAATSSIVRLDKNFKEKDTLFDEYVTVIDIKENNVLYFRDADNRAGIYSMDIPSKKTVELYSSSYSSGDMPFIFDSIYFGISTNRKKIFLNFVYDYATEKPDRYETVLISIK